MDNFVNVIERDLQARIKIEDILDIYIKLSLYYQSKIGYNTLIQNVFLKEIINLMSIIIVDLDIELKMKISRTI